LLIAFALVLRGTAPTVDVLQSARPVALRLAATTLGEVPAVAVYDVPRSVEYGLGFYRNQKIANYKSDEIPAVEHVVVAAEGSKTEVEFRLKDRHVVRIGGFAAQKLDFYLVSGAPSPPPPSNP